jgi:hypothetical protein
LQPYVTWYQDETGDLTNNGLWESVTGTDLFWSYPSDLNPWGGFFVEALEPCTLVLRKGTNRPLPGGSDEQARTKGGTDPSSDRWSIQLFVESETSRDGRIEIGVRDGCSAARDGIDVRKPPLPGGGVRICIAHPEWSGIDAGDYLTDYRDPAADQHSWSLRIAGSEGSSGTATLHWDGIGSVPAENFLYLVGEDGRAIDMREAPNHTFRIDGALDRIFRVEVRKEPWQGEVLYAGPTSILGIHPTPTRGPATVRFGIGRAGPARISVYDVSGRLVDRLIDRITDPGSYSLEWSPRSPNVRSGVYFIRLETPWTKDSRRIVVVGQ